MLPSNQGKPTKKMKAFKEHIAPDGYGDATAIDAFIAGQQELLRQLNKAATVDMSKSCIPVSIAKFLTMKTGDTYRFLVAHQQRHFLQINKTLAANGEKLQIPVTMAGY